MINYTPRSEMLSSRLLFPQSQVFGKRSTKIRPFDRAAFPYKALSSLLTMV